MIGKIQIILKRAGALAVISLLLCAPARADGALTLKEGVTPHPGIDALYRRLSQAVADLDSSGFSSVYAAGVYYLAPESPLATGLDEVRPHWDGWFSWMKEGKGSLAMDFTVNAREVHDDTIGYDIGAYRIVQKRPDEADIAYEGKLVVVTMKQPDGDWRFQVDAYNSLEKSE